jgi:hypothetical protein
MSKLLYLLSLTLLLSVQGYTQIKIAPPPKHLVVTKVSSFGIGFGLTRSVVYLPRNTKNNNDATGKNVMLTYDHGNLLRFTLEYNKYNSINISPTWYDVKAWVIESNVYLMAKFADGHGLFYPIAGLSFNQFSGFYTGLNDYLNLKSIYKENTNVTNNWVGLNVGVGYDYCFKNSALSFTYKMRAGRTEGLNEMNIQDICITAAYRVYLSGPTLKKIFKGTRSRYALSKPKSNK